MNELPDEQMSHWELQLNQLVDDELDTAAIAELEREAARDPELGRALAAAMALKQMLGDMPERRAPRRLQRRLLGVAGRAPLMTWLPHWSLPAATVACVAVILSVVNPGGPPQPSSAEIEQARRELAVALGYLDQAGRRANIELGRTLGDAMLEPVSRHSLENISLEIEFTTERLL